MSQYRNGLLIAILIIVLSACQEPPKLPAPLHWITPVPPIGTIAPAVVPRATVSLMPTVTPTPAKGD